MLAVAIYIQDTYTSEYNRVDLFDDEKISVTSSIQNINDIAKTFTDFSQTFTVPASKQNNKIFRHWYDNSNDSPFSTLVKSNAYIEIDTIPFRKGKIQLESANLVDGQPQDYSINFVGNLGNLKDKFNGLYLKDLTDTTYDFEYNATVVKNKVTTLTATSPPTPDIAFPLISSSRYWNYGLTGANDISLTGSPIRYNELFPAIKVGAVLNMIENQFGVNFDGTFLSNNKFLNAYLWLKNAENFTPILSYEVFKYQVYENVYNPGVNAKYQWQNIDLVNYRFTSSSESTNVWFHTVEFFYRATGTGVFDVELWNVTDNVSQKKIIGNVASATTVTLSLFDYYLSYLPNKTFEVRISVVSGTIVFTSEFSFIYLNTGLAVGGIEYPQSLKKTTSQTIVQSVLKINKQFPEIKIEDFFSGILKMFNLTCYSSDGINYTVEQLESYYGAGSDVDITKYVIQDKKTLNRVKTYNKINFEYEKSDSIRNVFFNSANGIEYGSLFYNTNNDGQEYSIKLPFEDLGFVNLKELLQVGYALKNDAITKYIPKPVILYDYTPTVLTALTAGADFYFNTNITGGTSTLHTTYRAFGQETLISGVTYGLNFNIQQSTLTNQLVENGLYNQYYSNYFANIFNVKARLIKITAILPTSIITSLKLNDNVIIRDAKYIINTMTTDLTTGEVQFELLTDTRL